MTRMGVAESGLAGGAIAADWNTAGRPSRAADAVFVLFLLAQCLDGIFTYVGVLTWGVDIEANPLISSLMLHFGHGPALLGAKIFAIALGIALHLRQVHGAIAALTAFYFGVAILPWTVILFD